MNTELEREFGWDDEIENDSPEFVILPEGDCDFEVIGFNRARHSGSEKLPPCNKAEVSIKLSCAEGATVVKHNLFLHSKCEGMLCAFFTAIGQRKHGEKLKMNWNNVIGAKGRCKIGIRNWKGNDGRDYSCNEIKRFYEPEENKVPASTQQNWRPGEF